MAALATAAAVCGASATALAFDAEKTFQQGTVVFSLQGGGGVQNNVEGHGRMSHIAFANITPRLSILPFDPVGPGWLRGSLETGLEAWVQHYFEPHTATAEGLKAAARYHFLIAGALVPYAELTAGAGISDLKTLEIRSTLTFILEAGVGLSYFATDRVAVTAGYRFQHVSNSRVERPSRGFNSDTGTLGVSYFFP